MQLVQVKFMSSPELSETEKFPLRLCLADLWIYAMQLSMSPCHDHCAIAQEPEARMSLNQQKDVLGSEQCSSVTTQ